MTPKKLKCDEEIVLNVNYEPDTSLRDLLEVEQEITIYPPPLFIMSPRTKLYDAKSIIRFKGYLSKLEFQDTVEFGPEMTITVKATNEDSSRSGNPSKT